MASQPAATIASAGHPQRTSAETVPVSATAPVDLGSKTGFNGMPQGHSGQEVKNSDDNSMNHAGEALLYFQLCPSMNSKQLQAVLAAYGSISAIYSCLDSTYLSIVYTSTSSQIFHIPGTSSGTSSDTSEVKSSTSCPSECKTDYLIS